MNSSTGTVTYTYQGNPVGKAAVTLSDEYLQKDNTENEAQRPAISQTVKHKSRLRVQYHER